MAKYYPDGFAESVLHKSIPKMNIKLVLKQSIDLKDGVSFDIFIGTAPYKNTFVIGDLRMFYAGHLQTFEMADLNIKNFSPSCVNYITLEYDKYFGAYGHGNPTRYVLGFKRINNIIYWGETPTPSDENEITNLFLTGIDLRYLQMALEKEMETNRKKESTSNVL